MGLVVTLLLINAVLIFATGREYRLIRAHLARGRRLRTIVSGYTDFGESSIPHVSIEDSTGSVQNLTIRFSGGGHRTGHEVDVIYAEGDKFVLIATRMGVWGSVLLLGVFEGIVLVITILALLKHT